MKRVVHAGTAAAAVVVVIHDPAGLGDLSGPLLTLLRGGRLREVVGEVELLVRVLLRARGARFRAGFPLLPLALLQDDLVDRTTTTM